MNFYPDTKPHISPSALAAWHHQRSMFVRSYFMGEKTPETAAMKAGKRIHALIEGGFLTPKHRYPHREQELVFTLTRKNVQVLGIPDSHEADVTDGVVQFVDYKTGKENGWDASTLASDLKMKATAWLVLHKARLEGHEPETVVGHIEFFHTEWDAETKELVVKEGESIVVSCAYSAAELDKFTDFIEKTIDQVNEEYPKFLASSSEFVSEEDMAAYAMLEAQKRDIEMRQEEIRERLAEQLAFGNKRNIESPFGTFYFTERKKYEYPKTLKVNYLDMGLTLEDAEAVAAATAAAKKAYEQETEPVSVTRSLSFKPKK